MLSGIGLGLFAVITEGIGNPGLGATLQPNRQTANTAACRGYHANQSIRNYLSTKGRGIKYEKE